MIFNFDIPIDGDTASFVSVIALMRGNDGQLPSGVTLPINLTFSGGAWIGSFSDGNPAPFYNYAFQVTWPDTTIFDGVAALNGDVTALGCALFTYADFVARFGSTNIINYSNKGDAATGTVDAASVQQAMNYAVDAVYDELSPGIYAIPLDFSPNGGTVPPRVKEWAMILAVENLYNARGLQDANSDPIGDKFTAMAASVLKDIRKARYGIRNRLPARVAVSGAATVVDTRPAAAAAGYPVVQARPNGIWPGGW